MSNDGPFNPMFVRIKDERVFTLYESNSNMYIMRRKINYSGIQQDNLKGFSMSKITSKKIDVIGIYRSQGANDKDLIEKLKMLFDKEKTTIIGGDLNICVRAHSEIT